MHRPIGVTLLAIGAGVAALFEIWRTLVFLGIANFTFIGKPVEFKDPQWGQAFWAILLAAIWIWVAEGFWNVRAYAWSFGIFISLFTIIFGFFAHPRRRRDDGVRDGRLAAGHRDLLLPELPGRPGAVRQEGEVAPDPRAEGRHGADAGRAGADGGRHRRLAAAAPPPPPAAPPAPPAPPAS